jgi:hypothetical protein
MFFGPVYPALVAAAMQFDPRFKRAVVCWVTADARKADGTKICERYAAPMLILHGLLLALGVLAVARAGELMFGEPRVFWMAGMLATVGVLIESELFSFVMTESVTFGLYALFAWRCVIAWLRQHRSDAAIAGAALGVLILQRPSYEVLILVGLVLFAAMAWQALGSAKLAAVRAALFALGCTIVIAPWIARNTISVGKVGLTERYAAATLIERFAFNDMTAREFAMAFPYCLPVVGEPLAAAVFGKAATRRFLYSNPGSFFEVGRKRRGEIATEGGSVDAAIGQVVRDELRQRALNHLLTSIPLGWCGAWAGGWVSLLLLPIFVVVFWRALRRGEWLFPAYAAPALAMLGLHALVANHYTRYNLGLIGPYAIAGAWLVSDWLAARPRARS